MKTKIPFSSLLTCLFICASHILFGQADQKNFLNHFAGKWKGEGKSMGKWVKDELVFTPTLDNKFLLMKLRALDGDSFAAEGYLRYNEQTNQFEFYEFSNGQWPVRILKGKVVDSSLVLEEKTGNRHIRITMTVKDKKTFTLEEAHVKETGLAPFVQETFTKIE